MSYHIYTTDGYILKRVAFGEASVLLYVLTRDLGLIMASARSIRLASSKLRPALQEYSLVSLSCIKGKNGWKITNVAYKDSYFFQDSASHRRIVAQTASLLLKIITGELPEKNIFETVISGFDFLRKLSVEYIQSFEALLVLRILFELGYIVKDSHTRIYLENCFEWNIEMLDSMEKDREMVVSRINTGLKESHM